MGEQPFRLEIFQGVAGLDALAASWRALYGALAEPGYGQLWEWHRSYIEALAPDPDAVFFGALYDGATTVAIVPLMLAPEQVLGLRLHGARLLLHTHMRHSGDILVHPQALHRFDLARTLAAMRLRLRRPWDVTRLGPVMHDAAASIALRGAGPAALAITEPDGVANTLPTCPRGATLDRVSANLRSVIRRAYKKLALLDGVSWAWARSPDEVDTAFARFLEVEASGWKGANGSGTAIALDPALRGFYAGLARRLAASGHGRINLLMHGDRVIAGQFAVVAGDRYHVIKIGYDESYRHVAPGNLLLDQLLQELADEPAIRFVDLISDANWHPSWKPVPRQVLVHHVFQPTPMGVSVYAALRSKQRLRPLVRTLRRHGQEVAARVPWLGPRPAAPAGLAAAQSRDAPKAGNPPGAPAAPGAPGASEASTQSL